MIGSALPSFCVLVCLLWVCLDHVCRLCCSCDKWYCNKKKVRGLKVFNTVTCVVNFLYSFLLLLLLLQLCISHAWFHRISFGTWVWDGKDANKLLISSDAENNSWMRKSCFVEGQGLSRLLLVWLSWWFFFNKPISRFPEAVRPRYQMSITKICSILAQVLNYWKAECFEFQQFQWKASFGETKKEVETANHDLSIERIIMLFYKHFQPKKMLMICD